MTTWILFSTENLSQILATRSSFLWLFFLGFSAHTGTIPTPLAVWVLPSFLLFLVDLAFCIIHTDPFFYWNFVMSKRAITFKYRCYYMWSKHPEFDLKIACKQFIISLFKERFVFWELWSFGSLKLHISDILKDYYIYFDNWISDTPWTNSKLKLLNARLVLIWLIFTLNCKKGMYYLLNLWLFLSRLFSMCHIPEITLHKIT